ncbi:MAG: hypothetical protein R2856_17830 [Caldilineaceae bacterium]
MKATPLTVYHGELALLTQWLDALPVVLLHTRPWLAVARDGCWPSPANSRS